LFITFNNTGNQFSTVFNLLFFCEALKSFSSHPELTPPGGGYHFHLQRFLFDQMDWTKVARKKSGLQSFLEAEKSLRFVLWLMVRADNLRCWLRWRGRHLGERQLRN
jgi:hypothetical protein